MFWTFFCNSRIHHEHLEVDPKLSAGMDFSKIVQESKHKTVSPKQKVEENQTEESEDFVDDPDVPPLI